MWSDAVQWGFLCAGNGHEYSGGLREIEAGQRVWAYLPTNRVHDRKHGYGGVGYAKGPAVQASDFIVGSDSGTQRLSDVLPDYANDSRYPNDPESGEWFLPVDWVHTVSEEDLVWVKGKFAIEHVALRPPGRKWRRTLERLKIEFPNYNSREPAV